MNAIVIKRILIALSPLAGPYFCERLSYFKPKGHSVWAKHSRKLVTCPRISRCGAGMDRSAFDNLLNDAIRELPDEFRKKLNNVAIIMEDYPSEELMQRM